MNRKVAVFFLLGFSLSSGLKAQSNSSSSLFDRSEGGITATAASPVTVAPFSPFSGFALSAVASPLGIGAELTTNLNPHLNLRASGNLFSYATTISTNGFAANAQLRLASARASIDLYPFHRGFRISPGIMFYNQNRVTASDTVASGTSFTLNGDTFYSANVNPAMGATPVDGTALVNLHRTRPAFTITGGWGNPLAKSGHWTFPVEVGIGLIGAPTLNVNLKGWACYDQAQTECTNIADPNDPIAVQVQSDLHAQVSKWNQDLEPLKTYPIISGGVAYSFNLGRSR